MILFAICAVFTLLSAGCFSAGPLKNADTTAGTQLKVCGSFTVQPLPAPWIDKTPQKRKNYAYYGRPDKQDHRHTTFAEVKVSPPVPEEKLAGFTLEKHMQWMKARNKRSAGKGFSDIVFTGRIVKRGGLDVIEYEISSLDNRSKHIKSSNDGKNMRMYFRGFCGLTKDKRYFDVFISERFPGRDTPESVAENKIFLDAVRIHD